MKEYSVMFKNMFQFDGRTRRREYWVCSLINAAIRSVFVAILLLGATIAKEPLFYATGTSVGFNTKGHLVATILFVLFAGVHLFLFVSMLGMTIRRYHDAGLPGWVYPICLVGTVLCCIGSIAHLIICFLPSKEDNQYGVNPKNAEMNEYEKSTSIVIAIILLVVSSFVVGIASFCNIIICGVSGEKGGSSIITEAPEVTTEDVSWMDTEETTELTDTETTEDLTEADVDNSDDIDTGDTSTDYGDGVPSDSAAFPLKIGNVTLSLTFDPGATVYASEYLVDLYRIYDNGTMFQVDYSDSFVDVGDTESLNATDYYEGIDGYTLVDSADKKLLEDGSSYITYYTYQRGDGSFIVNATIWQNIGASTYLEIRVQTDANDNIDDLIDGAIISL